MSPRRITILYSPDIRKQLWITLLVIILYRLLAAIPLPGMDQAAGVPPVLLQLWAHTH